DRNAGGAPRGRRLYCSRLWPYPFAPTWKAERAGPFQEGPIMATVFKPTRPFPLPPNPEIVQKDGRPHVRMRDDGKTVCYPVSKDGTKYLKPKKRWYIEY